MDLEKKLYKSNTNKIIDGVCGGIGEYFKVDPTLVRLAFVLLCLCAGGGLILYIVAAIIVPRATDGAPASDGTATSSSDSTGESTASAGKDTHTPSDGDTPTML